jgi:hypothetical protein
MTVSLEPLFSNDPYPTAAAIGNKWMILCGCAFSSTYKTGGDLSLGPLLEAILKEEGRGSIEWVPYRGSSERYL